MGLVGVGVGVSMEIGHMEIYQINIGIFMFATFCHFL